MRDINAIDQKIIANANGNLGLLNRFYPFYGRSKPLTNSDLYDKKLRLLF